MRLWHLALVLLAALTLVGVGALLLVRASLPAREGTLHVVGLDAAVEIRFDARARPYVRAPGIEEALFAQGFLHVQERLWQMELLRRAGRGRLAEALGASMLATDRELWRAGVPQLAARLEANASLHTERLVARYVAGANAGLASLRVRPPDVLLAGLPLRPFTPRDVHALGALLAFDSANNAENELLRLALRSVLEPEAFAAFLPDEASLPDFPYVVAPERVMGALRSLDALDPERRALLPSVSLGSNGWAVAPERSRSGFALFAFDSHDALALPNLFYEVHLFFGDGRQIRGWSVPGLPGVINGMNERIAWGLTNIGDSQDLYLETRHPEDPEHFLGPAGWYRARSEEVEIPVRGREAPERMRILHTRHGPLIRDDPPLSMAWTGHRIGDAGLDGLLDLNLARDWRAAQVALDALPAPSANVTYADVEGHVAFRTIGLLPVRGRGDGLQPLPGHEPDVGWTGMVPSSRLPQLLDPQRGFVAAANARVNASGVGPLVSADNAPGYRIDRIQRVLTASRDHTPESMRALQSDWHNRQAARLLPALLVALDDAPLSAVVGRARDELAHWLGDPVNAPDRSAPWIFERWYLALAERVFAEPLGDELFGRLLQRNYVLNHALDGLILDPRGGSPLWRGDRAAQVRAAFERAVGELAGELGTDPSAWRWDARHEVTLGHELGGAVPLLGRWLDRGPYPLGGGHATVGRARDRYDDPGRVRIAATVRVVIEMRDPMRVWAVIPGGQSGHPADAHYDDQLDAWLRGDHDLLRADFAALPGPGLRLEPREATASAALR